MGLIYNIPKKAEALENWNNCNYTGFGPSINQVDTNLTGTSANYDWGVYNVISNGGNVVGRWRIRLYLSDKLSPILRVRTT
ncbi:MAG: hypothetical protein KBT04_08355, partial [Bacteroidales bacterium]|nr:hypothetical protein [Candidatus Colimorpha onthohippi]